MQLKALFPLFLVFRAASVGRFMHSGPGMQARLYAIQKPAIEIAGLSTIAKITIYFTQKMTLY